MKRLLLLCGALLVLCAPSAFAAAGVNLAWGAGCWADNAVNSQTWACDTNTGAGFSMVGSFSLATAGAAAAFQTMEVVVDGQVDAASVPDWWQFFNAGSCRSTSLSASADFTTAAGGCTDPWSGQAQGGIGAWQTEAFPPPAPANVPAANRMRLKVAYVLVEPVALSTDVEYYGFKAVINRAKTIAPSNCAGCATPVTFVLNQILAGDVGANIEALTTPLTNQCITWNNSTVACALVPTRNRTWGEIKSLYR